MDLSWLAWFGNLIKVIGDLIPAREKVAPDHRGILFRGMTEILVRREGRYWYWPWVSEFHQIPIKKQVIDISDMDVHTADGKPVKVGGMVTYDIPDDDEMIIRAFVEAHNLDNSIDDEAASVFSLTVTSSDFSDIVGNRHAANTELTRKVRSRLREYGIFVIRAQLTTFVTGVPLLHIGTERYCSPS